MVVVVVDVEVVVDVVVDEVAVMVVEVTELETELELSLTIFVICWEEVSEFCEHATNKVIMSVYFLNIFYSSSSARPSLLLSVLEFGSSGNASSASSLSLIHI